MKQLLLALVVFALPALAAAENVSILPPGWDPPAWETDPLPTYDFGQVLPGESTSALFQVFSLGPTPLIVNSLDIFDDPYDVFAITSITSQDPNYPDSIPPELFPGEWLDVEITFTPSLTFHEATFRVDSNDRETPVLNAPLSGGMVPEPGTLAIWSVLGAGGLGVGWWRRRRRRA